MRVVRSRVWRSFFRTSVQNIGLQVLNVLQESELQEEGACKEFLQVRQEGMRTVRKSVRHYNLDMVLSVGYRVNIKRATQFRIWATLRSARVPDERRYRA